MKKVIYDLSIVNRLKAYGFIKPEKMTDNQIIIVNAALIEYVTKKGNKKRNLTTLVNIANKHGFTLNAALLNQIENDVSGKQKPANKVITIKHNNAPLNMVKSNDYKKKAPTIHKARKEFNEKESAIICTCLLCECVARNEIELKTIFGVNMQDRKVKMICLDCE